MRRTHHKIAEPTQLIRPRARPVSGIWDVITQPGVPIFELIESQLHAAKRDCISKTYGYDAEGRATGILKTPLNVSVTVGSSRLETNGAEVVSRHNNSLGVEVAKERFNVRVTGFDTDRDIEIRIRLQALEV